MPCVYSHPNLSVAARAAEGPRFVLTRIHALRPGTWPADPQDITITDQDIAAIAAAYDPARYQAPVVIGHPETDDPAWGWVLAASAEPDGLWLDVELLPEMADLVRRGAYRNISVSMWMPEAPGNPTPGVWALKHLGFLGAAPPAVKGLARVALEAAARSDERTVHLTQPHPIAAIKDDLRAVLRALEGGNMSQHTPQQTQQTPEAVALAAREAKLAEREAAIAARERELRRTVYTQELEAHVRAGRLLPAEVAELVALMERLEGSAGVKLAEGAEKSALDTLRGFLSRLPARVPLGERAGAQGTSAQVPMPKLPAGYRVSEERLGLHARALAHMAAHPNTDYLAAVRAVERVQ
jgi:hypothetical protein